MHLKDYSCSESLKYSNYFKLISPKLILIEVHEIKFKWASYFKAYLQVTSEFNNNLNATFTYFY